MNLSEIIKSEYNKSISECTNEEIYNALLTLVKTMAEGKQHKNSKKKLYYISAEFLIESFCLITLLILEFMMI